MRLLAQIYFWITGWNVSGNIPQDVKKCVVIAAPHTSNHDFVFARFGFYIMNINLRYMVKNSVMKFGVAWLFKATGAIPVDRSKKNNLVADVVKLFAEADELKVMIPPEGTRSLVTKWKTGFYYVALEAKVPIALGYLDYEKKIAGFGPMLYPTGDFKKDMDLVYDFYKDIAPKHPEKYKLNIY